MLHAKFQDHRTSCSGEEDFLRFLPYMGVIGYSYTPINVPDPTCKMPLVNIPSR